MLHHQNLDHSDEDVEEVQLKRDALVDGVLLDDAALSETGVVKNLLDVVQSEATKDGETTVQPDVLSKGEGTGSGGGNDERSETRDGDDSSTGQQRSTNVEVLLLLGSSTNEGDGTHHGNSVETGTGDQSTRGECDQGSDEGSLSGVEGSPESVLGNVAGNKLAIDIVSICEDIATTYLSGSIMRVPIMVPKLRARPPIATTQGLVTIIL